LGLALGLELAENTPGVSQRLPIPTTRAKQRQPTHITPPNMPPRLNLLSRATRVFPQQAYQPVAPFLYPFLHQQQRPASILSSLSDTPGAYSHRIRRGRGPSSGKGKTSGRGHKGQKAHGKVPWGFNGGQTPEIVVSGERGEVNQ
jgi:large subunit ribosomal protein L15